MQIHFLYTSIIHWHGKLHIRGQGLECRKNKPSSNGCRRAVVSASTSLVIWIFAPELHGVLCKISDKQQRTFERSGADRSKSGAKKRGEQEADLATPAQLSTGRATSPATRGGAGWSRESPWPAQGHRGGGGWGRRSREGCSRVQTRGWGGAVKRGDRGGRSKEYRPSDVVE